MPAKLNGFWDFKSYTERTWFRDLIFIFVLVMASYVALHYYYARASSSYEYTKLSEDQMQFINRIYLVQSNNPPSTPTAPGTTTSNTTATATDTDTCKSVKCRTDRVRCYLHSIFEGKLDKRQEAEINCILLKLNGE